MATRKSRVKTQEIVTGRRARRMTARSRRDDGDSWVSYDPAVRPVGRNPFRIKYSSAKGGPGQ